MKFSENRCDFNILLTFSAAPGVKAASLCFYRVSLGGFSRQPAASASQAGRDWKEADWKANSDTGWKRFLPEAGETSERDFRSEILASQMPHEAQAVNWIS